MSATSSVATTLTSPTRLCSVSGGSVIMGRLNSVSVNFVRVSYRSDGVLSECSAIAEVFIWSHCPGGSGWIIGVC